MRSFTHIVNVSGKQSSSLLSLLENKQQYNAMFAKFLKAYDDEMSGLWQRGIKGLDDNTRSEMREKAKKQVREEIETEIEWARQTLKKQNRIVWYLRYVRACLYADNKELTPEAAPHVGPGTLGEYNQAMGSPYAIRTELRRLLEHFMSLPIQSIQNFDFQNQPASTVIHLFGEAEEEWKKKAIEWFEDDDAKPFIDCGDGWYWVDTQKSVCGKEAKAMGHCGNSPRSDSSDVVLSLRRKKEQNGKTFWRPSLTFILNDEGKLTEMKGRGNNKPDAKYHPQIVQLLVSNYVRGIEGGGYLPQNNFALEDLSEQLIKFVLEKKPEVADSYIYWTHMGVDRHLGELITAEISEYTRNWIEDVHGEEVQLCTLQYFESLNRWDETMEAVQDISERYFYSTDTLVDEYDEINPDSEMETWRKFLKKHGLYDYVLEAAGRESDEYTDTTLYRFVSKFIGLKNLHNQMEMWRDTAEEWGKEFKQQIIDEIVAKSHMISKIEHDGGRYTVYSTVDYIVPALRAFRKQKEIAGENHYSRAVIEPTSDQYAEFIICAREARTGDRGWLRWSETDGMGRLTNQQKDARRRGDALVEKIEKYVEPRFLNLIISGLNKSGLDLPVYEEQDNSDGL